MSRQRTRGDLTRIVKIRRIQQDVLGTEAGAAATHAMQLADARLPLEDQLTLDRTGFTRALSAPVIIPELLLTWQAGVQRAAAALREHREREVHAGAEASRTKHLWNAAQARAELADDASQGWTRRASRARDNKAIADADDLLRSRKAAR